MSEAIIVEAKQDLERYLENYDGKYKWAMNEVTNELSMMLDFMRDEESGERSRLKYLLADFAEIALNSADLTRYTAEDIPFIEIGIDMFLQQFPVMLDVLRMIKKRMMEFEVGVGKEEEAEEEEGGTVVVVGLEKDVKQLIERAILVEKTDLVSVGIKGMVGVGKTTLAKQVYNHAAY
ncbi:probable disease resistance protein At1g59620 [Salvia hispanica]|uniref:probable disease resistance protein At1g59620 n=1 Tax=Salvia hispanica TaxID=49212 RepID=UPI002009911F|nr:probable disease resistance protein At1g59620 [Salvia hispanica]XP_047945625.1 probable disease resistance protein At1g59620 [Salvia hispanica]